MTTSIPTATAAPPRPSTETLLDRLSEADAQLISDHLEAQALRIQQAASIVELALKVIDNDPDNNEMALLRDPLSLVRDILEEVKVEPVTVFKLEVARGE